MVRHAAATVLLVCASAGLILGLTVAWPTFARAEMASESDPCAAWPGEIDPLPRVDSADPISARWARERAEMLAADARLVETMSLQEARRYWQHVLCLDPYSDAGRAGMFRTGPFRVSGPVAVEPSGPPPVSGSPRVRHQADSFDAAKLASQLNPAAGEGTLRDATATRGGSVQPGAATTSGAQYAARTGPGADPAPPFTPRAAPVPTSEERARQAQAAVGSANPYEDFVPVPALPQDASSLTSVDQELSEIETLVAEAHFHTALSVAGSTRGLLVASAPTDAVALRRARLEVLAATAAVALGRDQDALVSMSDALRANPQLQLDTATTSPKVVAILDEARRSLRPPRPARAPSSVSGSSADIGSVQ